MRTPSPAPDLSGGGLRYARGVPRGISRGQLSRTAPLGLWPLRLERLLALGGGGIGEPHRDAVGQPQVDRDDVAREELLVAIERRQPVERGGDIELRQADVHAVLEPQVPAALG